MDADGKLLLAAAAGLVIGWLTWGRRSCDCHGGAAPGGAPKKMGAAVDTKIAAKRC